MNTGERPVRIAVLGAGPVGLEAALYGRYLGYDVSVWEQGEVAQRVLEAGDAPLRTPFGSQVSPLGIAALEGQDPHLRFPHPEQTVTARQWRDGYLLPLAASDLLVDAVRTQCPVVAVMPAPAASPETEVDRDSDGPPETPAAFRVVWRDGGGRSPAAGNSDDAPGPTTSHADYDVVIDATGRVAARPDTQFYDGITLRVCPATGTCLPIAAQLQDPQWLAEQASALWQAGWLQTTHPGLYILGDKSYGYVDGFHMCVGLRQIQAVYTAIGDRADLDIYATMRTAWSP